MELQRRGQVGREVPVAVHRGRTFDLRAITDDIDGAFLDQDGVSRVRQALLAGKLPEIDMSGVRYGPPVAQPGALVGLGHNYAAHAAESGATPPTEPVVFLKHPNTVVGAYDDVVRPPGAASLDWEAELAIVIGRPAQYLPNDDAAVACIAGYTVSNDVSERHLQFERSGGQWSKGKSCETFNPLGPSFVPADEVADPHALRVRSWVNGEPRQDSSTSDMIFNVAQIVRALSQFMRLDPGDIVNTGTPEGVGMSGRFPYLKTGDVMKIAIDGLGAQRQLVVDGPSVAGASGVG